MTEEKINVGEISDQEMGVFETMYNCRAMRKLEAEPVPEALLVKLIVSFSAMAPLGVSLGLFYPYAVSCLVHNGRPRAVAISYGISTLSGVMGATYAMTIMLDFGFSSLLRQAAVGYVILTVFLLVYGRVWKGRFLSLSPSAG